MISGRRRTRRDGAGAGRPRRVVLMAAGTVVVTRLTGDRRAGRRYRPAGSPTPRRPATPTPTPSRPAAGRGHHRPAQPAAGRGGHPGQRARLGAARDAVLVLHVPKGLDRAYLFSLPRDLVVDIPAFPKAGYRGGRTKLTHAMSYGSRVPGKPKQPSAAQGYELLRSTVSGYTGLRIDAGAVHHLQRLRQAGGHARRGGPLRRPAGRARMHRRPDGKHRESAPAAAGTPGRRWSTRRASGTSPAGRRWTTPASATSPAATTPASGTSSS